MNKNRQLTQLSVVLKANPNSHAAAKTVKQLEKDVKAQIKATSLSKAKLAIGGQTSHSINDFKLYDIELNNSIRLFRVPEN